MRSGRRQRWTGWRRKFEETAARIFQMEESCKPPGWSKHSEYWAGWVSINPTLDTSPGNHRASGGGAAPPASRRPAPSQWQQVSGDNGGKWRQLEFGRLSHCYSQVKARSLMRGLSISHPQKPLPQGDLSREGCLGSKPGPWLVPLSYLLWVCLQVKSPQSGCCEDCIRSHRYSA